jgi:hypothetical protein
MKTLTAITTTIAAMMLSFTMNAKTVNVDKKVAMFYAKPHFYVPFEKELNIEEWMIDEDIWSAKPDITLSEPTQEAPLKIEPWMTDDQVWNNNKDSNRQVRSMKPFNNHKNKLAIRKWMTDDKTWRL